MAPRVKAKPAQFNEIGRKGRYTGVELKHAPLRHFGASTSDKPPNEDDMYEDPVLAMMSPEKGGGQGGNAPLSVRGKKRGNERNAVFNEIGKKGRFTGIELDQASLDSNGFEKVDKFFHLNQSAEKTYDADDTLAFVTGHPDLGITPPDQDLEDGGGYGEPLGDSTTPRVERTKRTISTPAHAYMNSNISMNIPITPIPQTGSSPHRIYDKQGQQRGQSSSRAVARQLSFQDDSSTNSTPRQTSEGKGKKVVRSNGAQIESPRTERRGSVPSDVPPNQSPKSGGKGKGKQKEVESEVLQEDEEQQWVEDDGGGFQDALDTIPEQDEENENMDQGREEEDVEDEHVSQVKGKQKKQTIPPAKKRKKSKPHFVNEDEEEQGGVRRSRRQKFTPAREYLGERVVYKRGLNGGLEVTDFVEVATPRRAFYPKKFQRGQSVVPEKKQRMCILRGHRVPLEGVDKKTEPSMRVWNYEGDCEIERRIAFPQKMTQLGDVKDFQFQKIFNELDYVAGGVMRLAPTPHGQKQRKPARDNTYLFFVIEGAVLVRVHGTEFVVGERGMFLVPRGNTYAIQNISESNTDLFFAQSRRVPEDEAGMVLPDPDTLRREISMSMSQLQQVPEEEEEDVREEEGEEEEEVPQKKRRKRVISESEEEERPKKGKKRGK